MSKRMTIVFDDDQPYTSLKVEAVRTGRHAKDIVAEAVREWIESAEDAELTAALDEARAEWQREGGVEAGAFFGSVGAGG